MHQLLVVVLVLLCHHSCTSTSVFKTKDTEKKETPRCPVPYDDKAPWQVWYSDPHDCNKYFVCDKEGYAVRMSCPAGLWWDNLSKTCMYVEYFPAKHQAQCFEKLRGIGTTPQLREIFIGRCWDYQLFKNPYAFKGGFKDCEKMFEAFAKAFVGKAPCGQIEMSDYEDLVQLSVMDMVPNRHLLWSGVYRMAQDYANLGEEGYTLESTLIGYIMNDVTWCGQQDGDGINFDWCPAFASCKQHVMATFWAAATEQFARQAGGVVTAVLNGSRVDGPAFRNNSFLAEHDVPNLNPENVALVRAWVVHDLEGPYVESCASNSLKVLESMVHARGMKYECQDNPAPIVHHLCSKNPFYPYCTLIREQSGHSPVAPQPEGPIRLDSGSAPQQEPADGYQQQHNKQPQDPGNYELQPSNNEQQQPAPNNQQQNTYQQQPSNNAQQDPKTYQQQPTSNNNNNNYQKQPNNYQQQPNNYQQKPNNYQQQPSNNYQQQPNNYQQQPTNNNNQPAYNTNNQQQHANNNQQQASNSYQQQVVNTKPTNNYHQQNLAPAPPPQQNQHNNYQQLKPGPPPQPQLHKPFQQNPIYNQIQ